MYNNEQIEAAQATELGVPLTGSLVVSAIAQSDDIALLSNDIFSLHGLLRLSLDYCKKNHVNLCPGKTKLQVFSNNATKYQVYYDTIISPIAIDKDEIEFVDETEHVGVIRSTAGNLPHLLNRLSSHRRAMAAVGIFGIARRSRANPAASLRIQSVYGTPVLLSGVSSLTLKKVEITLIDKYMKKTTQNLQKLPDSTPA